MTTPLSGEAIRAGEAVDLASELEAMQRYWTSDEGLVPMPPTALEKYPNYGWVKFERLKALAERLRAASDAPERDTPLLTAFGWTQTILGLDDAGDDPDDLIANLQTIDERCRAMRIELERLASPRASAATEEQRCSVLWANFNRCVRPTGHGEQHLTDRGFAWSSPSPAPPPDKERVWTGLMAGFAPAPTDRTTTNSGDTGGPT